MQRNRQSIRLKHYDYSSPGAYFVTICTQGREHLFGEIHDDLVEPCMKLNEAGSMIERWWKSIPDRFEHVALDEMIIMPNHLHGIIIIGGEYLDVGVGLVSTRGERADIKPAPTLGDIICAFKSITTNEYIKNVRSRSWPAFAGRLWQRNYHERIIRREQDLNDYRKYIQGNPGNWAIDAYYSQG